MLGEIILYLEILHLERLAGMRATRCYLHSTHCCCCCWEVHTAL